MELLNVEVSELLEFRKEKNLEIYYNDLGNSWGEFFVQAESGILMKARGDTTSAELSGTMPYVNKPIIYRDKRLTSYNWLSTETWASSAEAKWEAHPDTGWKLLVSSIQVRFPKDIKITASNQLYFKVHLYYPPLQMVYPVIQLQYPSVRELAKKSNNPLMTSAYAIDDLSSTELVEMEFLYADKNTLKGSPIVLHSCRGEFIEIGLTGNVPLRNINDQLYDSTNETWCVVNGKQVYDF